MEPEVALPIVNSSTCSSVIRTSNSWKAVLRNKRAEARPLLDAALRDEIAFKPIGRRYKIE
jgi:hypothetical protein